MAVNKHNWQPKRTEKGVKPVREWLECSKCGCVRDGNNIGTAPAECSK